MTARTAVISFALGLVALAAAGCGGAGTSNPSDAETRAVIVLAQHLRYESELASVSAARASDATGIAIATATASEAMARASEFTERVRAWGIDENMASAIFDGATVATRLPSDAPLFACSLRVTLDERSQLEALPPASVSARWAQLAMTAALEALRLSPDDRWHRELLAWLTPLLPETDRRFSAGRAGDPQSE